MLGLIGLIDVIIADMLIVLLSIIMFLWYIMRVGMSKVILMMTFISLGLVLPLYWLKGKVIHV